MNNIFRYLIGICIGMGIYAVGSIWIDALEKQSNKKDGEAASIKWRQNHFILSKENLYNELVAQGVDFPEIVQAQALLETDNFKSYACSYNNNLFGFRDGRGVYLFFEHWTEAVSSYKKFVQKYKHPPNDYYKYLQDSGYVESPDYIVRLRQIVNKNKM